MQQEKRKSFFQRFLDRIEKTGNKLPASDHAFCDISTYCRYSICSCLKPRN